MDCAHLNPDAGESLPSRWVLLPRSWKSACAGHRPQLCRERPEAPECVYISKLTVTSCNLQPKFQFGCMMSESEPLSSLPSPSVTFLPRVALDQVKIPVQLWHGTQDSMASEA